MPTLFHKGLIVYPTPLYKIGENSASFERGGSSPLEVEVPAEPNLIYDKKPRAVEFKPYTQQDYQAMNFDVKHQKAYWQLGKLGPDLNRPDLQEKV